MSCPNSQLINKPFKIEYQGNTEFQNYFYNDYNFLNLEKVLLKNLKENGNFQEKNEDNNMAVLKYEKIENKFNNEEKNKQINFNGKWDFNNKDLEKIFSSKDISEKNKIDFAQKIIKITKNNILKGYNIQGYGSGLFKKIKAKIDLKKQEKLLKEELLGDFTKIEEELQKLGFSNDIINKYFKQEKLTPETNGIMNKIKKSIFSIF